MARGSGLALFLRTDPIFGCLRLDKRLRTLQKRIPPLCPGRAAESRVVDRISPEKSGHPNVLADSRDVSMWKWNAAPVTLLLPIGFLQSREIVSISSRAKTPACLRTPIPRSPCSATPLALAVTNNHFLRLSDPTRSCDSFPCGADGIKLPIFQRTSHGEFDILSKVSNMRRSHNRRAHARNT